MPIYKGGNALKIYKGSYKPVNWYRGSQKVCGWKNSTLTGESASFDGTYDDTAAVSVAGNSEQAVTVQGKNLFDKSKAKYSTYNYSYKYITEPIKVGTGSPITLSVNIPFDKTVTNRYLYITSETGNLLGIQLDFGTSGQRSFTRTATTDYVRIIVVNYVVGNSTELNAMLDSLQLEINSTATAYEPFVPNSPSPDYPSAVNSAEGKLINGGKNLFDIDYFLSLTDNSTYYEKDVDGNLIQKAPDYRGSYPDLIELPAGTYTMTINTTNWRFLFKRIEAISTYTFTLPSTGYLALNSWASAGTNLGKVQLERGATPTSYEPFYGYDLTTMPVLRKIGTVADTWNPATGEVTRRIGVKVFDGTEPGWAGYTTRTNTICCNINFGAIGFQKSLCTHFENVNSAWANDYECYGDHSSVAYKYFVVSKSRLGVLEEDSNSVKVDKFKAYLAAQYAAGTPVTVYYQLATPTTESVTPVTIPTYPKTTIIEQDSTVKATIEATAKVADPEPA